jgi:pimeloyl-ACP methyl ester carboxylesterase
MASAPRSIALKAYHSPNGRCIHFAVACLRRKDDASAGATFVDIDTVAGQVKTCWVFFYPAGPNRRLLELVLARYAPSFDCDGDVIFLCINRPGKGGTSSSRDDRESPEKEYVSTACKDVVSVLDYYQIPKTSLFYMCAGGSFAYSFATQYPARTTGHIIGVSSWILRSSSPESEGNGEKPDKVVPQIHSLTHRLAMGGVFVPKWFVSSIASGSMNNMNGLLGLLPAPIIVNHFKKTLSQHEQLEFVQQYAERNGIGFVEDLNWMNSDGDGNDSEFINSNIDETKDDYNNDGNSKDISLCLTAQEDLGLIYSKSIPEQNQILLWHGTNDRMISVEGSAYLSALLPNAKLHKVADGTHQGTMFFFPGGVMVALNMISSEV